MECRLRPNTADGIVVDKKAQERPKCTSLSLSLSLFGSLSMGRVSARSRCARMIIRMGMSFKEPQSHALLKLTSIPLINTWADGKKPVIHQFSYPLSEMRSTQLISFSG